MASSIVLSDIMIWSLIKSYLFLSESEHRERTQKRLIYFCLTDDVWERCSDKKGDIYLINHDEFYYKLLKKKFQVYAKSYYDYLCEELNEKELKYQKYNFIIRLCNLNFNGSSESIFKGSFSISIFDNNEKIFSIIKTIRFYEKINIPV